MITAFNVHVNDQPINDKTPSDDELSFITVDDEDYDNNNELTPRPDDPIDLMALRVYQTDFRNRHPGFATRPPRVRLQHIPSNAVMVNGNPTNSQTGQPYRCRVQVINITANLALDRAEQPSRSNDDDDNNYGIIPYANMAIGEDSSN